MKTNDAIRIGLAALFLLFLGYVVIMYFLGYDIIATITGIPATIAGCVNTGAAGVPILGAYVPAGEGSTIYQWGITILIVILAALVVGWILWQTTRK